MLFEIFSKYNNGTRIFQKSDDIPQPAILAEDNFKNIHGEHIPKLSKFAACKEISLKARSHALVFDKPRGTCTWVHFLW